MSQTRYTGGCLCGAVRYAATGQPMAAGFCYCPDCRKASGSGSIPFILFRAEDIDILSWARDQQSS